MGLNTRVCVRVMRSSLYSALLLIHYEVRRAWVILMKLFMSSHLTIWPYLFYQTLKSEMWSLAYFLPELVEKVVSSVLYVSVRSCKWSIRPTNQKVGTHIHLDISDKFECLGQRSRSQRSKVLNFSFSTYYQKMKSKVRSRGQRLQVKFLSRVWLLLQEAGGASTLNTTLFEAGR